MDEQFIRERITELRLQKGISEYKMSNDLGQNKGYIQAISSGRALPSMKVFLEICEYFEITPIQFFDSEVLCPQQVRQAAEKMKKLDEQDLQLLLGMIERMNRA